MPFINALLIGPGQLTEALKTSDELTHDEHINGKLAIGDLIAYKNVFLDVREAVGIVHEGIGTRINDKEMLRSINDRYCIPDAFEILNAENNDPKDKLKAIKRFAEIFQRMPGGYFALGREELKGRIHTKHGANFFVDRKWEHPAEPLSAKIDGVSKKWAFFDGELKGIWRYLEPLWPVEEETPGKGMQVFGLLYEATDVNTNIPAGPSSNVPLIDEQIVEGALILLDIAQKTGLKQMPEQVFSFILSLAIYAVERYIPNGAQMARDWTLWQVETEIDHDKAHHLAWIYSNLTYDPTNVNGSRLPPGQQQREIVLAALKRKNMPQDKQRDLRQLLRPERPWSLKTLAQDGFYFLRKLWG